MLFSSPPNRLVRATASGLLLATIFVVLTPQGIADKPGVLIPDSTSSSEIVEETEDDVQWFANDALVQLQTKQIEYNGKTGKITEYLGNGRYAVKLDDSKQVVRVEQNNLRVGFSAVEWVEKYNLRGPTKTIPLTFKPDINQRGLLNLKVFYKKGIKYAVDESLGLTLDPIFPNRVSAVSKGGQADRLGVQVGWLIQSASIVPDTPLNALEHLLAETRKKEWYGSTGGCCHHAWDIDAYLKPHGLIISDENLTPEQKEKFHFFQKDACGRSERKRMRDAKRHLSRFLFDEQNLSTKKIIFTADFTE
jgi:hypothetical protein